MFQSHCRTINIFAHFVDLVLVCRAAENPSKVTQSVFLTQLCSLMLEHTGMVLTFILVFSDAEVHLWYSFLANTFLLKHRKLLTESPSINIPCARKRSLWGQGSAFPTILLHRGIQLPKCFSPLCSSLSKHLVLLWML